MEAGDRGEPPIVEGAERFALLGTSTRLIMMVRRTGDPASSLDRYREESEGLSPSGEGETSREDRRRPEHRWGDLRQVFYLPRPLPEALERSTADEPALPADPNSDEPIIEPVFAGLFRQEVRLPFSTPAQNDAFFQLEEHLFAKDDQETVDHAVGGEVD